MAIGGKQKFMVVTGPTADHFYFATNGTGGKTETEASGELHGLAANRNAAFEGVLVTKVDAAGSDQTLGVCLGATGNSPSVTFSVPIPKAAALPLPIPIGFADGIDTQGNFALKPSHANVEFIAFYRTDV